MEKLSKEELVLELIPLCYETSEKLEQKKTELLRRLSRLEELEKQVIDLLCCGNCEYYMLCDKNQNSFMCSTDDHYDYYQRASGYCPSHEPDGLSREERMK